MMIHRRKKIRKRRGSRTHGYGRIAQHRKSGQKGGVGKAGHGKHLWSYVVTKEPDYFGKHGFKRPQSIVKVPKTINVGELDDLANYLLKNNLLSKDDKGLPLLDLKSLGFDKLLGSGKLYTKLHIVVDYATERAQEKVSSIGGVVELLSSEEGE